jgi:hypothetical protein
VISTLFSGRTEKRFTRTKSSSLQGKEHVGYARHAAPACYIRYHPAVSWYDSDLSCVTVFNVFLWNRRVPRGPLPLWLATPHIYGSLPSDWISWHVRQSEISDSSIDASSLLACRCEVFRAMFAEQRHTKARTNKDGTATVLVLPDVRPTVGLHIVSSFPCNFDPSVVLCIVHVVTNS